jgi:hypothetical protein
MLQSGAHLIFICRIPAGVVLSEIYTEYTVGNNEKFEAFLIIETN